MTAATPRRVRVPLVTGDGLSRFLFFVGAVLFTIGAFAAGGDSLGGITMLPWWGGAFAACALAVAVV